MVYDGTSSGLNEALWAPSFWLPTSESALRMYDYDSYCVDVDLGEMFLNFPMDPAIRPHAGVDLSQFTREFWSDALSPKKTKKDQTTHWEMWGRMFMGMSPSPFNSVRHYYWADEFFRGDPREPGSPFRYDRVIFNLPGTEDFDPSRPSVAKWDDINDCLAGDISPYIDDLRGAGMCRDHAWQTGHRAASRLQYLGMQDAPRKRRPPTKSPGAWAGGVHRISKTSITKTVTQDKWDKGRGYAKELVDAYENVAPGQKPTFNHKDLERKRGYLIHLAVTFFQFGSLP